jgi:hypothetical protein
MKKILSLSIVLIGIYSTSFSQVNSSLDYVKIDYDAAGNRIKRSIIIQEDPEVVATTNKDKLEKQIENVLKIYPNPVLDNLTIELLLEENQTVELNLFDLNAKLIKKLSISNGINNFNIHDLAPGEYILNTTIGTERKSWKLTKL